MPHLKNFLLPLLRMSLKIRVRVTLTPPRLGNLHATSLVLHQASPSSQVVHLMLALARITYRIFWQRYSASLATFSPKPSVPALVLLRTTNSTASSLGPRTTSVAGTVASSQTSSLNVVSISSRNPAVIPTTLPRSCSSAPIWSLLPSTGFHPSSSLKVPNKGNFLPSVTTLRSSSRNSNPYSENLTVSTVLRRNFVSFK